MKQELIFIPLSNIESFPKPVRTVEGFDVVKIKGNGDVIHGFCCKQIEAVRYLISYDRKGMGYKQHFVVKFHGSQQEFIHLIRSINNSYKAEYIILMSEVDELAPIFYRCKKRPYLIIGDCSDGCVLFLDSINLMQMSFRLTFERVRVPFPYYDGPVEVTNCTMQSLMKHLYGEAKEIERR